MPKRKSKKATEKTLKSINIANYKMQLEELEAKGKADYKPKIGRQIQKIKKKLNKVA